MTALKKIFKLFHNVKPIKIEFKNPIPNCKRCEWDLMDATAAISADLHKCSAQGYKYCIEVYNNEQCKELYSSQIYTLNTNTLEEFKNKKEKKERKYNCPNCGKIIVSGYIDEIHPENGRCKSCIELNKKEKKDE